jgi:hypothetical protein
MKEGNKMPYCSQCGEWNDEDAAYCSGCGSRRGGKEYVDEPQWEIVKGRRERRKDDEEYIVLRRRKPELKYDLPPAGCAFFGVAGAVLLVAILFRVGGITWEQWPPLKWLTIVPIVVVLLPFLPSIIRWARKRGEDK